MFLKSSLICVLSDSEENEVSSSASIKLTLKTAINSRTKQEVGCVDFVSLFWCKKDYGRIGPK